MDHVGIDVHKRESQICILPRAASRRAPPCYSSPIAAAPAHRDRRVGTTIAIDRGNFELDVM